MLKINALKVIGHKSSNDDVISVKIIKKHNFFSALHYSQHVFFSKAFCNCLLDSIIYS